MDQTIIIDDGCEYRQEEFTSSTTAVELVKIVHNLFDTAEPYEVAIKACLAAWKLFEMASVVITKYHGDRFIMYAVVDRDGQVVPIHFLRTYNKIYQDNVPKNSLSTRIKELRKPVMWIEGGENKRDGWFQTSIHVGVPWYDELGDLAGTMVAALNEKEPPSEEQIFMLQAIAEAFSVSHATASRFQISVKTGQAIEREMMTQNLHDSVIQDVFSAQMITRELLRSKQMKEKGKTDLERLQSVLDGVRDNLKTIILNTDTRISKNNTILDCIRNEINRHEASGGPPVVFIHDGELDIPVEIAQVSLSLIKEGLANIRKHAQAKMVLIRIAVHKHCLIVSVIDDGKGLTDIREDDAGNGLHFGVNNLRRLVEAVQGRFNLESDEEEQGSILRAWIPLK